MTRKAQARAKTGAAGALRAALGAVLLAAALYAVLAAPGFVSDRDGTAPARMRETRR